MQPFLLPGTALATFILRSLPDDLRAPHPTRNFSSKCRPRHAELSVSIARQMQLESIGRHG
jgi:hypothetical protein